MIEQKASTRRAVIGKVIGNKMDKTIIVQVENKVKHHLYGKFMRRFTKLYAHDDKNVCHVGDIVKIQQCRPMSKTKHWLFIEMVEQADKEEAV